jgi:hypothetical protein
MSRAGSQQLVLDRADSSTNVDCRRAIDALPGHSVD